VRWPLILAGLSLAATGGIMLAITHQSSVLVLVGMSLLFGLANGFAGFANQAVLYTQSPAEDIGVASGLSRTFSYFGAIFSSSLIGIAFGQTATDAGLHVVGWVIGIIGVVFLLLTVLDRTVPRRAAA